MGLMVKTNGLIADRKKNRDALRHRSRYCLYRGLRESRAAADLLELVGFHGGQGHPSRRGSLWRGASASQSTCRGSPTRKVEHVQGCQLDGSCW